MTFARTAIGGAALWLAAITALHFFVNLGGFGSWERRRNFRVGFLPVT